jgi:hypothetical protein
MPTTDVQTFDQREVLEALREDLAVTVSLTIKTGYVVARKDVLGVITESGLGRRRARTTAAGAGFATNSAVGHLTDASVFAAGDVLTKSDGMNVGTVQSVDPNANTVTLTGNAAVAVAAGVAVLASDGSQVAQAIADGASDGVGDTTISVKIGGYLKETGLRGLDSSAKAELGGVSTVGAIFKF